VAAGLEGHVTYVAKAPVAVAHFAARPAAHRRRRPPGWATVECGPVTELPDTLAALDGAALVDSLGAWVAVTPDFAVDAEALVAALRGRRGGTVVVSEEVGLGVHPSTEPGR